MHICIKIIIIIITHPDKRCELQIKNTAKLIAENWHNGTGNFYFEKLISTVVFFFFFNYTKHIISSIFSSLNISLWKFPFCVKASVFCMALHVAMHVCILMYRPYLTFSKCLFDNNSGGVSALSSNSSSQERSEQNNIYITKTVFAQSWDPVLKKKWHPPATVRGVCARPIQGNVK